LNERLAAGLDPNTHLLIPQSGRHLSLLELSLLAANDKAGEALLLAGAEPDDESQLLGTPLELAAQQGMLRTLKFLVNQDPMRLSTSPSPPLLLAVGNQHMEVVRFLLQRSDDYVRDGPWQTLLDDSLQVAVSTYSESSLGIVVELVSAGANPTIQPTLVEAAAKCSPRLVELLIAAGAGPTMQSNEKSPAELALACLKNDDTKGQPFCSTSTRPASSYVI